ncbi:TonB-dependent receptor [Gracilimonas mengyeensis]|uniref:Iron complex outermembrane recepter protein n=1 Tax=Gracilimonas mengyeensis TaxID=1302730 RepID=A0A521BS33_9BACT|nr:TonB-dependent receptor [Gracilimonas mengyeensis]SMO49933.1 iron complex outermembrane recepter protein [Gracilimonas mengyeensis]
MFTIHFKKSVLPALLFLFTFLFSSQAWGQTNSLEGVVYDAQSQEPLAGASVYVPGTNIGTSTSFDGSFKLQLADDIESLTVSFVGYQTKEVTVAQDLEIYLEPSVNLEEVLIQGVRAEVNDPVAQSTIQRREIEQKYNGEQPVFLLEELTPAIFSYSESGTRLANYGGMRLRGIAQERINMTLNGVPLNDMIDHGVFFSNFTDISNSFESMQVQRGVGTSSNGVASYAGSVNFESVNIEDRAQGGQVELGMGSFDTYRMNTSLSSGMIDDKWSFYGSYSRILSDGYRYNTSTDASSFFFSGGYFGEKDMIKINAFNASSKNGLGYSAVAESDLEADPRTNYLNENDKDDFGQRLVQLQHTHIFSDQFKTNASLYYGGSGGDYLYTYADSDTTLAQINYPLYNDHYGLMVNGFWENESWNLSSGIHGYIFDRVNEESFAPDFENPYYYETSDKKEFSWFGKAEWNRDKLTLFADLQIRTATLSIQPDYSYIGIAPEGDLVKDWTFINPKIGASYTFSRNVTAYASAGRMGREPTRIDIFGGFSLGAANYDQARADSFAPEYVNDYEAGVKLTYQKLAFNANYFFMDFQDEIAPIGEVLAFGVQKRRNIPDSYRTGVELEWNYLPIDLLSLKGNLIYMQSEIESFTTGVGDTYTNKTPILSPEWIVNQEVQVRPVERFTVALSGKYVSESYLELTNNPDLTLPSYFVLDASAAYELDHVALRLELNNLADEPYYSSGSPVSGEPGYLVNAGLNFFLTASLRF